MSLLSVLCASVQSAVRVKHDIIFSTIVEMMSPLMHHMVAQVRCCSLVDRSVKTKVRFVLECSVLFFVCVCRPVYSCEHKYLDEHAIFYSSRVFSWEINAPTCGELVNLDESVWSNMVLRVVLGVRQCFESLMVYNQAVHTTKNDKNHLGIL